MLMNQAGLSWSTGTRPKACSKKCASPTTVKGRERRASRRSSASAELAPSARTISSGRWASTIAFRSSTWPSTGGFPFCLARVSSPTTPTTEKRAFGSDCTPSTTVARQLSAPTTSTRLLDVTRRVTASQTVQSANTESAIATSVSRGRLTFGIQTISADTAARPTTVPAAARIAEPSA